MFSTPWSGCVRARPLAPFHRTRLMAMLATCGVLPTVRAAELP